MESKTAFEAFLSDRGYTVAPVTVEDADYLFNDVLAYAREKKDKKMAEQAREGYFDYFDASFDFEEAASRSLFGREIPQILLLHDDQLNAENLSALLERLERRGYKFVTLEEAMSDPAYATQNLYVGECGDFVAGAVEAGVLGRRLSRMRGPSRRSGRRRFLSR